MVRSMTGGLSADARRDAEADADGDVARRVDEHAVAPGRDVERHGRVRAAGPAAPVVDVQLDT